MVQSFTAPFDETTDRALGRQWLGEYAEYRTWVHETDGTRQPVPRFVVDKGKAVSRQNFELPGYVVDVQCQVVQSFTAPFDETTDRALGRQWLQQLDAGLANLD